MKDSIEFHVTNRDSKGNDGHTDTITSCCSISPNNQVSETADDSTEDIKTAEQHYFNRCF